MKQHQKVLAGRKGGNAPHKRRGFQCHSVEVRKIISKLGVAARLANRLKRAMEV